MQEEKNMDYVEYIQKRLKEIEDTEERKVARELLLEGFMKLYTWTEGKYQALEERIWKELSAPWKSFHVHTTIVKREHVDPINGFWHPLCPQDLKSINPEGIKTIYLKADDAGCRAFLEMGRLSAIEEKTEREVIFQIKRAERYEDRVRKLYHLFTANHVPWQTVPMGHLERFFDLVPEEEMPSDTVFHLTYGSWEEWVREDMVPLWNIEQIQVESQEFRLPLVDEVIYEHIYHLEGGKQNHSGILVDTREDILSLRYEENKVLLKTRKERMEQVELYQLHQKKPDKSYGYDAPVLSNERGDNLSARYTGQTGRFIQTPAQLQCKIKEWAQEFPLQLKGCEITSRVEEDTLAGDMNHCLEDMLFDRDERKILLFTFQWEEEGEGPLSYLKDSWIRYLLSQIQIEYLEYQCRGVCRGDEKK